MKQFSRNLAPNVLASWAEDQHPLWWQADQVLAIGNFHFRIDRGLLTNYMVALESYADPE